MQKLVYIGLENKKPFAIMKVSTENDHNFEGKTIHVIDSVLYKNWFITMSDNNLEVWNKKMFYRGDVTPLMQELL